MMESPVQSVSFLQPPVLQLAILSRSQGISTTQHNTGLKAVLCMQCSTEQHRPVATRIASYVDH